MGIDATVLGKDDDLLELARAAVRAGADCLGAAGGDGTLALVAEVAIESGLPFVCIPAGTRNHFALDLGLDREDPLGALDAFGEAVEREIDVGDVSGHMFLNNVSIGAYGEIVANDAYRDNKVGTALLKLPELIGPDAQPLDLRFTDGNGVEQFERARDPRVEQQLRAHTASGIRHSAVVVRRRARCRGGRGRRSRCTAQDRALAGAHVLTDISRPRRRGPGWRGDGVPVTARVLDPPRRAAGSHRSERSREFRRQRKRHRCRWSRCGDWLRCRLVTCRPEPARQRQRRGRGLGSFRGLRTVAIESPTPCEQHGPRRSGGIGRRASLRG